MKVRILPEHLGKALGELRRVTPKRGALPILTNVLAEDDGLGRLTWTMD